jgi:DNA phosphorothioation-associated putative methyltransferase
MERHKTALVRYELSKPVRTLLEYGQLRAGSTFFDYGCGQGTDVAGLRNLGYSANGWDPVHRPDGSKAEADVVNLGYVLNVIDDPAERLETLVDAFRHSRRLLVVSALIRETADTENAATFRDGVVTKRNTFQKYFGQQELQQYLEDALDVTAVPVSLGVFCVFRDPVEQQDFIEARTRRTIDWTQISARLGLGQPRKSRWELFYEQHKELLDAFWDTVLRLGRLPAPEEFGRHAELRDVMGSPKRALRLFAKRGGAELLAQSTEARLKDLLVYTALSNLRKRVPFGHLSSSLRLDIRTFFGNHKAALAKGLELLYAAGDPGEIELACEDLKLGWQDEQALYVHRSLVDQLPPALRAYVGCARALFGAVQQADVVKLHKASGKVTFLAYDDFDGKPLPELRFRTKVNLRTRWVQVFDHSAEAQLLYFKERLLAADHPRRPEMDAFSVKARKLGIPDLNTSGPAHAELDRLRELHCVNENLNKRRGQQTGQTPQSTPTQLRSAASDPCGGDASTEQELVRS